MGLLNYNYKDIIQKIKYLGFHFKRKGKGSHEIREHPITNKVITIYKHGNKSITPGVVSQIIHITEHTPESFKEI